MDIKLTQNQQPERVESINKLALLKHCAFAGQCFKPTFAKYMRSIGYAWVYADYLRNLQNHFSEPIPALSDPTEKGQFSNIVGRGLADYFAMKLDNVLFTFNYEAVMRLLNMSIKGRRPDLIGITKDNGIYAIEAKGYACEATNNHIRNAVIQFQTGPVPINASIASISHSLYIETKCRYTKTKPNAIATIDQTQSANLIKAYYKGISSLFDISRNDKRFTIRNCSFYKLPLFDKPTDLFNDCRISILLPDIMDNIESEHFVVISYEIIDEQNLYISRDGIGLCID